MENEGIIVVSGFDGMGCLYSALKRANIKVKKYFAYEIDKYAMKVALALHPDIIHLGDITKASLKDFGDLRVDLFCGGSPCQGFSFAGKQLAFDDPRSKLFFEYVRLWNEIKNNNPDAKFLLENVQMKKNELRIISEYMGVFPVNINSNLQSAQNRNRWYWSNIKTKDVGLFAENWTDIPQPEDKGILLKDILQPESEIDEKYYLSDKMLNYLITRKDNFNGGKINIRNNQPKASTITASCKSVDISDNFIKVDKQGNKKADQNKAGCLTAGGHSGGNHSDMDIVCVAMRGRNPENPSDRKTGSPTEQRLEPNDHGKTNCLTSVAKDNLILQRGSVRMGRTEDAKAIRRENAKKGIDYSPFNKREITHIDYNKSDCLLASPNPQKDNLLTDGYKLRRLTPRECGRLQTFNESELDILLNCGISDTQLYKMFGNGWTIEPIAHILSFLEP